MDEDADGLWMFRIRPLDPPNNDRQGFDGVKSTATVRELSVGCIGRRFK